MEKVVTKEVKAGKRKDKEHKQDKQVAKLGSTIERTTQKTVEKHAKT